MGLVLDSGVLIAAERGAKPVSELLASLEQVHGETEIVLSSITVIELEHGLHRANTPELAKKRREYLDTVFAAIPVSRSPRKWPKPRRRSTPMRNRADESFRSRTC